MRQGALLVNLGSPDSPAVSDVRRYLREFLMDGRVMDLPYPGRWLLVHGMILPFRPKQSAHAYQSIWTEEGSPLVAISRRVQSLLQERVGLPVELAMRYQNPSIAEGVEKLLAQGVEEVLTVPLFPHYAMSSYETAAKRVEEVLAGRAALKVQPPFFAHPTYIRALVASAREYLSQCDYLLFSFHGLPERHLRKSDPTGSHCLSRPDCCETASPAHATCYRAQCYATVKAFAKLAGLEEGKYSTAFQSRLGRDPWLSPYTDVVIRELAAKGVKRLAVICPAFVTDCLETLEEIGMRGKESFLAAGGREFVSIPCLNDRPDWIEALVNLVNELALSSGKTKAIGPAADS